MNDSFEGYGETYFFIPKTQSEKGKLDARDKNEALAKAKELGHGIVVMEIAEV